MECGTLITSTINATKQQSDRRNIQNGKASNSADRSGVSAFENKLIKYSTFATNGSSLGATLYPYVAAMIVAAAKLHIVKRYHRTKR